MPALKTLDTLSLSGKRALVRVDLNVPADAGKVTDASRIERLKPTIDALAAAGAKIILLSHFGRPDGKTDPALSLSFLVDECARRWGRPVAFAPDCIDDTAVAAVCRLKDGDVLLLENVRFHKGEEQNHPAFAHALAALGDAYINDAFSAAHRAHASTEGLGRILPCAAGLLMEEELRALASALGSPEKPVAAIVGGSKVSTKLDLLYNLVAKMNHIVLGGGMANTFLLAQGRKVGRSLAEEGMIDTVKKITAEAARTGCAIHLPVDAVVAPSFAEKDKKRTIALDEVADSDSILDAGPQTVDAYAAILAGCRTVLWNGPLGVFEVPEFAGGTMALAARVAAMADAGARVIAGGGDTVAALEMAGITRRLTYVSAAGGAFLEYCEGKELPGVKILYR